MGIIWILLIVMQFKHFIADYLLQGKYMLGKFRDKGWVLPLAAHCFVHFLFTFLIALGTFVFTNHQSPVYFWSAVLFGLIDFSIHFIMDRIKASPKMLGRYQNFTKKEFEHEILPLIKGGEEYAIQVKQRLKSNTLFWWSLELHILS